MIIPYVFNGLAGFYSELGLFDSALYYNSIALYLNKRLKRRKWLADSYLTRGVLFNNIDSPHAYDSAVVNLSSGVNYRLAQLNLKQKV